MRGAIFLDRDGVLNRAIVRDGRPFSPMSLAEFELLPGVAEACEQLALLGPLIVVTNQPEIARGRLPSSEVELMHAFLRHRLPITDVLCCPHDNDDGCSCRKPLPGMLLEGAMRHGSSLEASVMVGDRWSDVAAGQAAGCRTVLIGDGYSDAPCSLNPDSRAIDLSSAVSAIAALTDLEGI